MLELVKSPSPPAHLMLGPDALEYVGKDRLAFDAETREWEGISRSTDFR